MARSDSQNHHEKLRLLLELIKAQESQFASDMEERDSLVVKLELELRGGKVLEAERDRLVAEVGIMREVVVEKDRYVKEIRKLSREAFQGLGES